MSVIFPRCSAPNLSPHITKCFSEDSACRNAFCISAATTSKLLSATYVRAILTLSLETTPANIDRCGSGVWCPFLTRRAYLEKSIFISHTKCPLDLLHPGFAWTPSGKISKATATFLISLSTASCQSLVPLLQKSGRIVCGKYDRQYQRDWFRWSKEQNSWRRVKDLINFKIQKEKSIVS